MSLRGQLFCLEHAYISCLRKSSTACCCTPSHSRIWTVAFDALLTARSLIARGIRMIAYDNISTGKVAGTGWSVITFLVACLGALGGILVALSVKYSDSIMKSIAVSGAIVLSGVGGFFFLDGPMTLPMALGSVAAILATQNYTFDTESSAKGSERKVETSPPPLSLSMRAKPPSPGSSTTSPTSASSASV